MLFFNIRDVELAEQPICRKAMFVMQVDVVSELLLLSRVFAVRARCDLPSESACTRH